ncbi:uncharacterized protein [Notamacropus eugenii]|uniref:uncharacterized protein n=1 Tax=Notamacropus eugenii TaxID=9315 RepID=UPI003B66C221
MAPVINAPPKLVPEQDGRNRSPRATAARTPRLTSYQGMVERARWGTCGLEATRGPLGPQSPGGAVEVRVLGCTTRRGAVSRGNMRGTRGRGRQGAPRRCASRAKPPGGAQTPRPQRRRPPPHPRVRRGAVRAALALACRAVRQDRERRPPPPPRAAMGALAAGGEPQDEKILHSEFRTKPSMDIEINSPGKRKTIYQKDGVSVTGEEPRPEEGKRHRAELEFRTHAGPGVAFRAGPPWCALADCMLNSSPKSRNLSGLCPPLTLYLRTPPPGGCL